MSEMGAFERYSSFLDDLEKKYPHLKGNIDDLKRSIGLLKNTADMCDYAALLTKTEYHGEYLDAIREKLSLDDKLELYGADGFFISELREILRKKCGCK